MPKLRMTNVVLALGALCVANPSFAQAEELPEITEDGLHRVADSKAAVVYVDPAATLEPYAKVQLLEAYVAFKKNWERDHRQTGSRLRVSSSDMERIKSRVSKEFTAVFTEELEEAGYPVVAEAGEDVLLVRPAIISLDVNAPDLPTSGRTRTYVESAGEMTLYLELYDSVTGDLVAKAMDARADNGYGGIYNWANTATNKAAADKILRTWADLLVGALNEAHEPGSLAETDKE